MDKVGFQTVFAVRRIEEFPNGSVPFDYPENTGKLISLAEFMDSLIPSIQRWP
jgi:hypothetical protein